MAHGFRLSARIGADPYRVEISSGKHRWLADEPPVLGGQDAGPGPFLHVLAGLAACTAITLTMYANRKDWALTSVEIDLALTLDGERPSVRRFVTVAGMLAADQQARLAEIAEKTPVTLALKGGMTIDTTLQAKE